MANSIATPLRWLLLVAVAIRLCMAAGANDLYCLTNENSAVYSDAMEALSHLRAEGKAEVCQANCEEDYGCNVVGESQTAQLKFCGFCDDCVVYLIADYSFTGLLDTCAKHMDDGTIRTAGTMQSNEAYAFVVDGKGQSVDAGIQMKLSK